jgi:transcriptional regulator with XRE-family HTH domain
MDNVGARIKAARERAVYGQAELARAAGITPNGLWQIEKGLREPRPATIRKIAQALGIEPSSLVEITHANSRERATDTTEA